MSDGQGYVKRFFLSDRPDETACMRLYVDEPSPKANFDAGLRLSDCRNTANIDVSVYDLENANRVLKEVGRMRRELDRFFDIVIEQCKARIETGDS